MQLPVCSVQINSRLDSQNKVQMFYSKVCSLYMSFSNVLTPLCNLRHMKTFRNILTSKLASICELREEKSCCFRVFFFFFAVTSFSYSREY